MTTHEQFIARVAELGVSHAVMHGHLDENQRATVGSIKLVYGSGPTGTRGITYFNRWDPGDATERPFVEVCAFGQENWVQLAGTTLHELGHVIAGWKAGHGPEWHAACAALGLRCIRAAGTQYHLACFETPLRLALWHLPKPSEGAPVRSFSGLGGALVMKPCGAGIGTRGGKSRGTGSGSRYRLWECSCEPPVKVRVASDHFRAHCDDCTQAFMRVR